MAAVTGKEVQKPNIVTVERTATTNRENQKLKGKEGKAKLERLG